MKMIQTIAPIALATVLVFVTAIVTSDASFASSIIDGANAAHGNGMPTDLFGVNGVLTTIVNILLFVIGALSVIMLIFGGLRYVISGGNSSAVTAAKNTILYAIVGLVIAFLAFAAINFVINTLAPSGVSGGTNV